MFSWEGKGTKKDFASGKTPKPIPSFPRGFWGLMFNLGGGGVILTPKTKSPLPRTFHKVTPYLRDSKTPSHGRGDYLRSLRLNHSCRPALTYQDNFLRLKWFSSPFFRVHTKLVPVSFSHGTATNPKPSLTLLLTLTILF
jgi:hypothetical protein